jgi:ABC-type antimicrobial peptide transport system permease subunit
MVAGVATAVAVLAGALLVGDSVRGSLRDLVEARLGRADLVVVSPEFFREALADAVRADGEFAPVIADVCPLISLQGVAIDQRSGRRSSRVQIFGVDDRFWRFHDVPAPAQPSSRGAVLSAALAREIGAGPGDAVLLRVQRPSDIPLESLHGRREELGRTLRLTVSEVRGRDMLGEFSLQPQQGDVRAAFVPLSRLQQDLAVPDRVNALVADAASGAEREAGVRLDAIISRTAELEDFGLTVKVIESRRAVSVEGAAGLIDPTRADRALAAAAVTGLLPRPVLTYLANTMRVGTREIPYSVVTAVDLASILPNASGLFGVATPIVLNQWAARDLQTKPGDRLSMDYFLWEDPGRLVTRTAEFTLAAVVPLAGAADDRDLAPPYPGITDSDNLRDWDPPFPIDLGRIRPIDEDYWRAHRTTPKAFIPLELGQSLWKSRYGSITSIRLAPPGGQTLAEVRDQYAARLRETLDPRAAGFLIRNVRLDGLGASRGATDFGQYFTYFSFFLVVSALLLAALFFRLGVEQRAREVGLLRSVGFTPPAIRRLFSREALALSIAGAVVGAAGAVGYAALMMAGLRTWWIGAVGTTSLRLHVTAPSILIGGLGSIVAAQVCIWWTLRSLERVSERSLLAGQLASDTPVSLAAARARLLPAAIVCLVAVAGLLVAAGFFEAIDPTVAFFGAGGTLLIASFCVFLALFRRRERSWAAGSGWPAMSRLGWRNAAFRPARSALSMAVMASATFILVAVDAFRRTGDIAAADIHSGLGGYSLIVDTALPMVHDPASVEGRDVMGLSASDDVRVTPFRVLPGDDVSCLNLYEPRQPRVVGARSDFLASGRFAFQASLASEQSERANPWRLLEKDDPTGTVPVAVDATSMTYVLHRSLGDEILVPHGGRDLRLRIVAVLADSVLQSELIMSEANFVRLFPSEEGYRLLLVETPPERANEIAARLEDSLSDFGADAVAAADRLSEFHTVENTYLSTFQTLGGLGLLLGTVGLAAVLLRNVLERRRELALLGAVGYRHIHLFVIVSAENALLLAFGLIAGTLCALVAVIPSAIEHGGRLPTSAAAWLLLVAVFLVGLLSSVVATRAAMQARLLDALRAE